MKMTIQNVHFKVILFIKDVPNEELNILIKYIIKIIYNVYT